MVLGVVHSYFLAVQITANTATSVAVEAVVLKTITQHKVASVEEVMVDMELIKVVVMRLTEQVAVAVALEILATKLLPIKLVTAETELF